MIKRVRGGRIWGETYRRLYDLGQKAQEKGFSLVCEWMCRIRCSLFVKDWLHSWHCHLRRCWPCPFGLRWDAPSALEAAGTRLSVVVPTTIVSIVAGSGYEKGT